MVGGRADRASAHADGPGAGEAARGLLTLAAAESRHARDTRCVVGQDAGWSWQADRPPGVTTSSRSPAAAWRAPVDSVGPDTSQGDLARRARNPDPDRSSVRTHRPPPARRRRSVGPHPRSRSGRQRPTQADAPFPDPVPDHRRGRRARVGDPDTDAHRGLGRRARRVGRAPIAQRVDPRLAAARRRSGVPRYPPAGSDRAAGDHRHRRHRGARRAPTPGRLPVRDGVRRRVRTDLPGTESRGGRRPTAPGSWPERAHERARRRRGRCPGEDVGPDGHDDGDLVRSGRKDGLARVAAP